MLCPEISNFSFSTSKTTITTSPKPIKDVVPLSTSIRLVLPSVLHCPKEIKDSLANDGSFYSADEGIPTEILLSDDFIRNFVVGQGGQVTLASKDNDLFITPDGDLFLKKDGGFIATPLTEMLGKSREWRRNFINRSLSGLSKSPVHFSWRSSEDPLLCPSSLAKFFHDKGVKGLREVGIEERTIRRAKVRWPRLMGEEEEGGSSSSSFGREEAKSHDNWLGAAMLGIEESSIEHLDEDEKDVLVMEWKGLFEGGRVEAFEAAVKKWKSSVPKSKGSSSWLSYSVSSSLVLSSAGKTVGKNQSQFEKVSVTKVCSLGQSETALAEFVTLSRVNQ